MGATAVTMLRMETMGQRGVPRTQKTRGQCARGLEHQQECAWAMAAESNASIESGTARKVVSSNGAARVGTGQGSMRSTVMQGTAGCIFFARKDRDSLRVRLIEYPSAKEAEKAFSEGMSSTDVVKDVQTSGLGDAAT